MRAIETGDAGTVGINGDEQSLFGLRVGEVGDPVHVDAGTLFVGPNINMGRVVRLKIRKIIASPSLYTHLPTEYHSHLVLFAPVGGALDGSRLDVTAMLLR